jgi:fatty acid desaturase
LFKTSYLWYLKKTLGLVTILFSAVWIVLQQRASAEEDWTMWGWLSLSSFLLGLFWQQLAFFGHDLGHNSVSGSAAGDWVPGLVVTSFFGVSIQWWKRSHNVHHVSTNSLEHDCDIQYLPVFALDEKMLAPEGFFSSYHKRIFRFDGWASWLVRWQHVLYWPVMGIARNNLYVQSLGLVWDQSKPVYRRKWEKCALIFFWSWHLLLLLLLPSWTARLFYYTLAHSVAGTFKSP